MKCVLTALDSQYVHTNPAVRYLSACLKPWAQPVLCEYNVNQQSHFILRDLLEQDAQLFAFSCYIWNIEYALRLCEDLKKARPSCKILLGGPEVSFSAVEIMQKYSFIDYILCGEGEESLPALVRALQAPAGESSACIKDIAGLIYRDKGTVCGDGAYRIVKDLNRIPFPYTESELVDLSDRIVYYESSRGCPYACAYCLSGAMGGGLRELPLERVKKELAIFIENKVPLVKFIDRTFNADKARAKEILRFILASPGDTRFHFEIGADLLDDELLELFSRAPKGMIQLEAGVQTCNPAALEAVVRRTDMPKLKKNAAALMRSQKVHLHLDLIAGLPHEDFASFAASFNEVYSLQPHQLQLGFLKLLKGSSLYREAEKYGIVTRGYPPYEVIRTNDITAEELLCLKGVEEILQRYYNSGHALHSIRFLLQGHFSSAFDFYLRFSLYCSKAGCLNRPMSIANQLCALYDFALPFLSGEESVYLAALLKLDYLCCGAKGTPPAIFEKDGGQSVKDAVHAARQAGLLAQQPPRRAKFDLLPIHPGTLQKAATLVMTDPDDRDELTGQCKIRVISSALS